MREKVGLRQPLPEVDVGRLALDVVRLPLEDDWVAIQLDFLTAQSWVP